MFGYQHYRSCLCDMQISNEMVSNAPVCVTIRHCEGLLLTGLIDNDEEGASSKNIPN